LDDELAVEAFEVLLVPDAVEDVPDA